MRVQTHTEADIGALSIAAAKTIALLSRSINLIYFKISLVEIPNLFTSILGDIYFCNLLFIYLNN